MTSQPLFARRQRADDSYARHDETVFDFLDRVDDIVFERIRVLMNEWFHEVPADKAVRLREDFSSRGETQVEAAFLELLLHAAFVRTPLEVEIEPGRSAGRQPDFRCWPAGREDAEFLVEARIVGDPPSRRARDKRLKRAFDDLNRAAPQGFSLWIRIVQEGKATPGGAELRRLILPWLASFDRRTLRAALEAGTRQVLPTQEFRVRDWVFLVEAWPWSDQALANDRRRLVGVEPARTGFGASTREFANALKSKKGRYEVGERPYVIALGNTHAFQSHDDALDVLYGSEVVQFTVEDEEPRAARIIRAPDGLFRPHRNRRVSAGLHVPHLAPWTIGRYEPELWINPFGRHPLSIGIPWAVEMRLIDGDITRRPASQSLRDLFGLSEDWPGPEKPFEAQR
jgi:hypothetical protein